MLAAAANIIGHQLHYFFINNAAFQRHLLKMPLLQFTILE